MFIVAVITVYLLFYKEIPAPDKKKVETIETIDPKIIKQVDEDLKELHQSLDSATIDFQKEMKVGWVKKAIDSNRNKDIID